MTKLAPLLSSKSSEWATPQQWFDYLNLEFKFTLDPCADASNAKCKRFFSIEDDGLSKSWALERAFVNPPFGRQIGKWMEKAYNECINNHAGLNIDGSRIGVGQGGQRHGEKTAQKRYADSGSTNFAPTPGPRGGDAKGRWPANLLLDDKAARQLDAQTGNIKSGMMKAGQQRKASKGNGGYHGNIPDTATAHPTYGDSGGASRFFYCPKASRRDRTCDGRIANNHPTVKPRALMEYLCRLVTPPGGGLILDPFMGSGSTGIAALATGNRFVGIELEPESFETAKQRIEFSDEKD